MENLSNALFLEEASDSFISFANFFANMLLCIQKYVRLTFELEKIGNCYITYWKSQQAK